MAFTIKRGLFQFDFTDHHAVLGVSVTADPGVIRKRYLKLARQLHPDSLRNASDEDKRQASELLSKLVNPAYETLKGKARNEHQIILEQTGKRLASEGGSPNLASDVAQGLLKAAGDANTGYQNALKALTKQQYQPIGEAIANIGTISELNLVYLMKKAGKGVRSSSTASSGSKTPTKPPTSSAQTASSSASKPPTPPPPSSPVDTYVRRAQEYITKNNFAKAVLELRDGLKLDPQNSRCHALLGMAYLKQKQVSMAKVHITKALQSNPNEPIAIQCKNALEKKMGKPLNASGNTSGKSKSSGSANGKSKPSSSKSDKSQGGGRFGGLFGGKKS